MRRTSPACAYPALGRNDSYPTISAISRPGGPRLAQALGAGCLVQRLGSQEHLPHLPDARASSAHLLAKTGCFLDGHRGNLGFGRMGLRLAACIPTPDAA